MNIPSNKPEYFCVKNNENHGSIWPAHLKAELPSGWRFTGIAGSRESCLRHLATEAPTPRSSRAFAVPFIRSEAPRRLFVFPHAGSGAAYYHFLARALRDDSIEVQIIQYPGREMRMQEPPVTSMSAMLEHLTEEISPQINEKPAAFFGHSMGALLAFELARHLRTVGLPASEHLFLSGRQAPQVPGQILRATALDDREFVDAVGRRYQALPAELLANAELMSLVITSLRADFTLMERYAFSAQPQLPIGITLLNGESDPWVTSETLQPWQDHTLYPVQSHIFPEDTFIFQPWQRDCGK